MSTYTKKVTIKHSAQTLAAHDNHPIYANWFSDQWLKNLVDKNYTWLPYRRLPNYISEILLSDQTQADSLIQAIRSIGPVFLPVKVTDFDEANENLQNYTATVQQ